MFACVRTIRVYVYLIHTIPPEMCMPHQTNRLLAACVRAPIVRMAPSRADYWGAFVCGVVLGILMAYFV